MEKKNPDLGGIGPSDNAHQLESTGMIHLPVNWLEKHTSGGHC